MKHSLILISYLVLTAFGFICQAAAQDSEPVPVTGIRVLTLDEINKNGAFLESWKFHPGDNPEWASPTFDDTAWEIYEHLIVSKGSLRKRVAGYRLVQTSSVGS